MALNCQYDLSNRTIVNEFDLAIEGEIQPSLFEEAVVDSPNVMMKITKRGGDDVDTAQVTVDSCTRFKTRDHAIFHCQFGMHVSSMIAGRRPP